MKEKILGGTGLKVTTMGFGGIPIMRVSEEQAIKSGIKVASMILRIDDVVAAKSGAGSGGPRGWAAGRHG